jgi:predicted metalloprotease
MSTFFAPSLKSPRFRASLAGLSVVLTTGLIGATASGAQADAGATNQRSSVADLVTSGDMDFDTYLANLVQDTSGYWSDQMTSWSSTYGTGAWQPLYYQIVDGDNQVASQCTDDQGNAEPAGDPDYITGADPAFFCSADMTVYLSSQWLYDHIWTSEDSTTPSDFGVAYVVAHEMGHAVQHDLGITEPDGAATVAPTELQADCLAGVWSNAKYYEDTLDAGDIDEAVNAASSVGDYDFDQQGHHGTPEERTSAFMTGYNSGQGDSCTLGLPGAM